MRKFWTLSFLLAFTATAFSQIYNPVKWSFSSKQLNDTEYNLIFTATIEDGWYIYSQYLESEDGPIPTSFTYDKGSHFSLVGKNAETSSHRKELDDPLFDNMHVVKFAEKVTFTQKVKVTDFAKPITGYLTFMTCNNERCLPPSDVDFSFQLKSSGKSAETPTTKSEDKTKPAETATATPAEQPSTITGILPAAGAGNEYDPVKWTADVQKTGENIYTVNFKAAIEAGWAIYSQFVEDGGPIPTSLTFEPADNFALDGKAAESSSHKIEGNDPFFGMNVTKFKEDAAFSQKLKVSDPSKPIKGYLTYMTCNDERCLPPVDVNFSIDPANLTVTLGGEAGGAPAAVTSDSSFAYIGECKFSLDKTQMADCGEQHDSGKKGYWKIFILGFLGGLAALLTPCVFPMVPLTVSFFTKSNQSKKKGFQDAAMYGFFILLVYVLFSLPFHLLDSVSPDILNEFSTNVAINLIFFAIFLVFAISFFGYFEITLPESWSNKAASAEGVGGVLGIFFMALTLVLVSFSCTGPILGSLLGTVLDSDAGAMQLTAGMAGFGVALGLPFGLFAAFPNWLKALPKSGGWMTTVKVVLGFLELALALKFLSNADLVKHWGILKIEVFLGLWIVIFIALGIYLLGKIRFPHDSPLKKIPPVRLVLAILSFAFAGYMMTGLRYDEKEGSLHSLTLLSGLAPPACYSIWHPCDCPQNLSCFKDFCEGLEFARKVNKPIMIDFTGHACANCRRMEETVWPKKEVYNYLKDEFVVISLYVDEKIELPADQQKSLPLKGGGTQRLRNVGHKWAYFQRENFNDNSQPQYVLISHDGVLLNQPVSGMQEVDDYANFLKCGLDKFKELNAKK